MQEKLQRILNSVSEYIEELQEKESWEPGKDWVKYSGPNFDKNEYVAAIKSLLGGWLIFGKESREFGFNIEKEAS